MLNKLYINEAQSIRRDYLNCLAVVLLKEDEQQVFVDKLNSIKEEVENSDRKDDQYYVDILQDVDHNIEIIKGQLKPVTDKINKLDERQRILWNNIKSKYPGVSEQTIKNEIIEAIIPINEEFVRLNKDLYDRIEKRNLK